MWTGSGWSLVGLFCRDQPDGVVRVVRVELERPSDQPALAFPILFWAWVDRFTGYALQGREVLPALMLIPLVAGEIVSRHSARIADRRAAQVALAASIGLIAVSQAYAWWFDARTVAGGPGTIWPYTLGTWSPPAGWLIWAALTALGTAALLTFAASEGLIGPPPAEARPESAGERR